eukprot:g1258.t1 g1258   contig10:1723693-1724121(-)
MSNIELTNSSNSGREMHVLHSMFVFVAARRIAFLVLSVAIVNLFFTKVLKIPKSEKKMFDECPWPFTIFHDPPKFIKDSATWVVVFWYGMCQIYSRVMKVRSAVPLP